MSDLLAVSVRHVGVVAVMDNERWCRHGPREGWYVQLFEPELKSILQILPHHVAGPERNT
jgi:hypothetical protein